MITTQLPTYWQDLQMKVCRILEECGFQVEIDKTIKNARGSAPIDLYAKESGSSRAYTVICDCRNWKLQNPNDVVHGFSRVASDIGAHLGIIFTSHAKSIHSDLIAEYSNVEVVTWDTFQEEYLGQWLDVYFYPKLTENLTALCSYTEPLFPVWYQKLAPEDAIAYHGLYKKYEPFGSFLSDLLLSAKQHVSGLALPLAEEVKRKYALHELPNTILQAEGYREFLNSCLVYGDVALREFQQLKESEVS